MTERAEIERLLQKTGRTLEGLPENYGVRKRELWATFVDREEGHLKSLEMANTILHQSDVIELLIGALQDSEPVVRCKDCKARNEKAQCLIMHTYVSEDGYCHWGRRRKAGA